jgi:diacylglycerol kinase (ATP)
MYLNRTIKFMRFITQRLKSFAHAFRGLKWAWSSQVHIRIHSIAALLVCAAGLAVGVSAGEWIMLLLCIGCVFSAELFNTAIEVFANKLHPNMDPEIGKVKDLAAAAVLICALTSALVGFIIFIPYIKAGLAPF